MYLLDIDTDDRINRTKDLQGDEIPPYAILSHTWGADVDEVTFQDVTNGAGARKVGYEKIKFCAQQARRDGLSYFWVDTCCIDKTNLVELSEAINSMFRWYSRATMCYVFLSDVPQDPLEGMDKPEGSTWVRDLRRSRWFTRGWTLQELLAPTTVDFFSNDGYKLGSKSTLEGHICDITGIPARALRGGPLPDFSIAERLSWQDGRKTKKEEDKAYSLLGVCGVSMPLIYGEGIDQAFKRLKREIDESLKGMYAIQSLFTGLRM